MFVRRTRHSGRDHRPGLLGLVKLSRHCGNISNYCSTSFRQAARQASLVEVKISALSWPSIILLGTRSKFHGRLHTLSDLQIELH